jgi:S-layer family protein
MRRKTIVLIGGVAILLSALAVYANHIFSDVPPGAIYHNQVEWIFNRGVTSGCAPGLYCPDANVTRAQMAIFMRNLGVALTPTFVSGEADLNLVDLDASPVVCMTASYTPTFPQIARADSWAAFTSTTAGGYSFGVRNAVSTDGGVTWTEFDGQFARAGATGSEWTYGSNTAFLDLIPGTAYLFGVQTFRAAGTVDPTDGRCETVVQITNRNPASSPFGIDKPMATESTVDDR